MEGGNHERGGDDEGEDGVDERMKGYLVEVYVEYDEETDRGAAVMN